MSDERTTEMVRLRDVLDNSQGELARLLQERLRLDERILQLQNKIRHPLMIRYNSSASPTPSGM